jgi:hypothetical protein
MPFANHCRVSYTNSDGVEHAIEQEARSRKLSVL